MRGSVNFVDTLLNWVGHTPVIRYRLNLIAKLSAPIADKSAFFSESGPGALPFSDLNDADTSATVMGGVGVSSCWKFGHMKGIEDVSNMFFY